MPTHAAILCAWSHAAPTARHLPPFAPLPTHAGLYFGLGVGVGSAVGGLVYQRHGAQAVYLLACAVLLTGWLLCSLAQLAVGLLRLPQGRDKYLQVAAVELSDVETNGT